MKKLLSKSSYFIKISAKEYEASINALNIFFGAVIGVSLGNVGDIATWDYVQLLVLTAAAVTAILFVTYSERRYWSIVTAVAVLCVLWVMDHRDDSFNFPPKLLPTLGVWAGMAIITEFYQIAEDTEK